MNSAGEKEAEARQEQKYNLENPEQRSFFKSLKEYLKDYCESSSIQGLNYMIKDISVFERLWWITIFILCLSGCGFMIYEIWNKWENSPVLVSFATRDRHIYEIPFPAVTICPESKIKTACINYTDARLKVDDGQNLTEKEGQYFDYMSTLCNTENHLDQYGNEKFFNQSLYQFFEKCQSVSLEHPSYCSWMGKVKECDQIFKPILTDEGLCFSYNMYDISDIYSDITYKHDFGTPYQASDWDVENGYPEMENVTKVYPKRSLLAGAKNSLIVLLFTPKSDILYSCKDFSYQGLRVSLHMPNRVPRPSQVFFSVPLDRFVAAAIMPSLVTTSSTVKTYNADKRNCFFANERKLKYFKIYSQNNCNLECYTNFTLNQCGCVAHFMPHENSTKICGVESQECVDEGSALYPKSVIQQQKLHEVNKSEEYCHCLPVCIDLSYNTELSNAVWDWKKEMTSENAEKFDKYHVSAVKIFFKNDYFIPLERNELYGPSDFISNFGGILGLFTGFSLFSIAEIIYFLSVRLIENYRNHGYWAGQPDT